MSEYCTDAPYTPPTSSSIVLGGIAVTYRVNDPVALHDPRTKSEVVVDVMQHVKGHPIAYSFRDGNCVAMRNGKRYEIPDESFLKREYRHGMWRARDQLKAAYEAAQQRNAPDNVRSILRAGLGRRAA